MASQALQPVKLERTDQGYWTHPVFEEYWVKKFGADAEGCTDAEWKTLKQHFEIETCVVEMENDITEAHLAYKSYFVDHNADCLHWNPIPPTPEWFLISINDTESGPIAMFAKHMEYPE